MKKMILNFALSAMIVSTVSGQNFYIPQRGNIDSTTYFRYLGLLKTSFLEDSLEPDSDHKHNIFIAYDYLGAPIDTILKFVYKSIAYDPIEECVTSCKTPSYTYSDKIKKYPKEWRKVCLYCDSIFAKFNKGLMDSLKTITENDQKYRKDTDVSAFTGDTAKKQTELDSANLKIIEEKFRQYGYPGKRLVGTDLSEVAFMVIQHSSLEKQEMYLPLIEKAVKDRDLNRIYLPYLIDRIRMGKKLPQLYGTQLIWNKKKEKLELYPVEDIENVDARRDKMNLMSLKDYLERNHVDSVTEKK
jgi:hypothetical protein